MDVSNKLFGFYRAKVVDNKDPKYFGRVVVWVPQIMPDVEETRGIWARPANNPVGGRNSTGNNEHHYMGSSYIPKIGSWIFVFFEAGNPDTPYYFGSCDLENTTVLPENRIGSNPEDKWTIFKSHEGRTIVVSDDSSDARVEITGKKRMISNPPSGDGYSVYQIDGNQTVIFLDERSGIEKLLIRTRLGDFINVDIDGQNLQCYFKNDIRIECGKELSIKAGTNIRMEAGSSLYEQAGASINRKAGGSIYDQTGGAASLLAGGVISRDGASIQDQGGVSGEANPAEPVAPVGERGGAVEMAAAAQAKADLETYNNMVSGASKEAYSDIQTYKKNVEEDPNATPPSEFLLACTLGKTSERYESGGRGPTMVSTGTGDKGGVSYGTYQFKSEGGMDSPAAKFSRSCSYSSELVPLLPPGSSEFTVKWKEVAAIDEAAFQIEEHAYIESTYYNNAMAQLKRLGVNEETICFGIRELIWSTSVQFGPTGCYNIFDRANVNSSTENLAIIDQVYKEKSRVTSYFKSSAPNIQQGVLKRFMTERLQNIAACTGEECDTVPEKIKTATPEELEKIKSDDKDQSPKDGYEDFII